MLPLSAEFAIREAVRSVTEQLTKEDIMTSEQALRRMRQRIFSYPDNKEAQADRVLLYLKKRMLRYREVKAEPRGPYSGLTKAELKMSRTCEPDWF